MKKRLFLLLILLFFFLVIALYLSRDEIVQNYNNIFQQHRSFENQEAVQKENTSDDPAIKITFLDIGQGDASFIEWPDTTQMLVDCSIDARILEALGHVMSSTDHSIDYLLITHPDQDHYGGCVDVMKRFEIKHIVYTGFDKANSPYFSVFQKTIDEEIAQTAQYAIIEKEQIWKIGDSSLHFLYPDFPIATHPLLVGKNLKNISNDTSLVFSLDYGTQKVLFTGDMEFVLENYLMKKYSTSILDVDVLKVGHHGSSGSSSDIFLNVLTPRISVISAGTGNHYGHPTLRTVKRLERSHSQIWRTDRNSDILVRVTKDAVYVENE